MTIRLNAVRCTLLELAVTANLDGDLFVAQEQQGAATLVGSHYTAEERQRTVVPTTADERRESTMGYNLSAYQQLEMVTVLIMRSADYTKQSPVHKKLRYTIAV